MLLKEDEEEEPEPAPTRRSTLGASLYRNRWEARQSEPQFPCHETNWNRRRRNSRSGTPLLERARSAAFPLSFPLSLSPLPRSALLSRAHAKRIDRHHSSGVVDGTTASGGLVRGSPARAT